MPRRKPWNGSPPKTPAAARRVLLDVARECVERMGLAKAGLSDVAEAAGVTRQTVYRYFDSAEHLFQSAAVLSSGGFHQRLRRRTMRRETLAERMVENLVLCVCEIPQDPHLMALTTAGDHFSVATALRLSFVQQEMVALAKGELNLSKRDQDELGEILIRLLHSFLSDPGVERSEKQLRAYLYRWLVPMIDARLAANQH